METASSEMGYLEPAAHKAEALSLYPVNQSFEQADSVRAPKAASIRPDRLIFRGFCFSA